MTPTPPTHSPTLTRAEFDALVREIRPQLYRYCARMMGSAIDGEDIAQETLVKAYAALPTLHAVANPKGWLFRIAHNQAIDHLRRYERLHVDQLDDDVPSTEQDPWAEDHELAGLALSLFVKLPPMQRSCVFLKDVMGHSLAEISELHSASLTAVKAALHRGRSRLRQLSALLREGMPPQLETSQTHLLAAYADRFNARDFDALRTMLAEDVRLDLVGKEQRSGASRVGEYFNRYGQVNDWRFAVGLVENRPALLVYDPQQPSSDPIYFVLITWADNRIAHIRDYRYARHVLREAWIVKT